MAGVNYCFISKQIMESNWMPDHLFDHMAVVVFIFRFEKKITR